MSKIEDAHRHIDDWISTSGYSAALGVELESVDSDVAVLVLPYSDENANPGKALHGGCAASLGALGGQCVTRAALGPDARPWHTASIQVNYLAAAIGQDVRAEARLRRRGKAMCFVDVSVETLDHKPIAQITAMVRGRAGTPPATRYVSRGDDGSANPGAMGPHISKLPFMRKRQITVDHMIDGHSRLRMPFIDANADAADGMHEGALLAFLDTTGAMAAWAEAGPGPYKASTPSLQAQILAPPSGGDLVGYGRTVQRDEDLFWADVEAADAKDGRVVARGTVVYRIVP